MQGPPKQEIVNNSKDFLQEEIYAKLCVEMDTANGLPHDISIEVVGKVWEGRITLHPS